jgi:hypothetical protein
MKQTAKCGIFHKLANHGDTSKGQSDPSGILLDTNWLLDSTGN